MPTAALARSAYTMVPACPAIGISPSTTLAGTVGAAYSQTLAAERRHKGPYTWSVASGTMPTACLTLGSAGGLISGTPTTVNATSGHACHRCRATDSYGCSGTILYADEGLPGADVQLRRTLLRERRVGTPYSQTISSASGGTGTLSLMACSLAPCPEAFR